MSLLAGCHADEPVGPRLLRSLVAYLARADPDDPLLEGAEWWILPHINPDGERRNASWQHPGADRYGLAGFLRGAHRELPGDDLEFGFPRSDDDGPFHLHASLHGMAFAGGPWFLIEPAWVGRAGPLMRHLEGAVAAAGYRLHDVERRGEKGFHRIARGFCTRPDSEAMRSYFLRLGDAGTAARFRPSSMETLRAAGGDPLTLVSEMPLFLLPGVGEDPGPPDRAAEAWRDRLDDWRSRLASGEAGGTIDSEAAAAGLTAMPVADQMALQWEMIAAAVDLVASGPINSRTEGGARRRPRSP